MRSLAFFLTLISATGCALAVQPASSVPAADASAKLPNDYFAPVQECWSEWAAIVDAWVKHGGGIRKSIYETRRQVESDEESTFAKLVRETWKRQATAHFAAIDGAKLPWPISDTLWEEMSSASWEPSLASVSQSCGSLAWLGPTLMDQMKISGSLPREMPAEILADPHKAANWLTYWMLVR